MIKDVTFSCGHVEHMIIVAKDPEAYINRISRLECNTCSNLKRDLDQIKISKSLGLPELTGNKNMLRRAYSVRNAVFETYIENSEMYEPKHFVDDEALYIHAQLITKIASRTNAEYWYELSDEEFEELCASMLMVTNMHDGLRA